jgi:hypothetical protein
MGQLETAELRKNQKGSFSPEARDDENPLSSAGDSWIAD